MNKLMVMVGIPGSGKSYFANILSKKFNAVVLSSDALRIELFNNVNDLNHDAEVFKILYDRAAACLKNGQDVIIDSTNINSKRRIDLLIKFRKLDCKKICYYVPTDFEMAKQQNFLRDRHVPEHAIKVTYLVLNVPMFYEGWDEIHYLTNENDSLDKSDDWYKKVLEKDMLDKLNYDRMFNNFNLMADFRNIYEIAQDSTHHTFSISRHTYYVYDYIYNKYNDDDKLVMLWAAMLHDIGKSFCKNFKDGSRYANFIGHENVSAEIAARLLGILGYDDNFITDVTTLVQLHMRLSYDDNEKTNNKLRKLVGPDIYNKLVLIREADMAAK